MWQMLSIQEKDCRCNLFPHDLTLLWIREMVNISEMNWGNMNADWIFDDIK